MTQTSVTEIVQMRIKRNLNFNRNGTTEQLQMRSSKYQSMKEGTKPITNKSGPKKVNNLSEHNEGDFFRQRSRKKSDASRNDSEISDLKILNLAQPDDNERNKAANIFNDSNADQMSANWINLEERKFGGTNERESDTLPPENITFYNQQNAKFRIND